MKVVNSLYPEEVTIDLPAAEKLNQGGLDVAF